MTDLSTVSYNDRRHQPRINSQTFVRIEVNDDDDDQLQTILGLTQNFADQGLAVLTYFPLPIGTKVSIKRDDDCIAHAEVTSWEWDYNFNMARIGLFLLKKSSSWSLI